MSNTVDTVDTTSDTPANLEFIDTLGTTDDDSLISMYKTLGEASDLIYSQRRAVAEEIQRRTRDLGGNKLASPHFVAAVSNYEMYDIVRNEQAVKAMHELKNKLTPKEFDAAFTTTWKCNKRSVDSIFKYGGEIAELLNSVIIRTPRTSIKVMERDNGGRLRIKIGKDCSFA